MQFTFIFEGNLAEDPELRFTPGGKTVTKLRVGHNTRRRSASGEWTNGPTMWVTVTAWEGLAERAAEWRKGDTVVVNARDDLSVWAYLNQANEKPGGQLQVTAENLSLSARFDGATSTRADKTSARTSAFEDQWPTEDETRELEPTF
ncbi:single-stranded DNA-binding protein [Dactylosporangium sp. CA-139114]|uniref:single-stranded DNA-binding protein n=1 Tax=Dactylosporangium sp. CA-139114 TaxID=3239931 RepID=UPI003D97E214